MKTVGVGLHHLGSQDNPGAYQGLIPISFTRTDAPDIPTVCMSECPLRPRQRVCGDKLVMQSAALRDSEVLLAVKGTPFSCLAKKAGKMVSGEPAETRPEIRCMQAFSIPTIGKPDCLVRA